MIGRSSLWRRLLLMVVAVSAAPVLFVWLAPWYETTIEAEHRALLTDAIAEARAAGTALAPIAERYGVRLRALDDAGRVVADVDRTLDTRWADIVGVMGLSPAQRRTLERYDTRLPPVAERPVVDAVRGGAAGGFGCRLTPDRLVLVCEQATRSEDGRIVHGQTGSPRSVRSLYGARYQLLKLAVQVAGLALLAGLWLVWRARRPLRRLRAEVLARTAQPVSTRAITVPRWVEAAEMATAFNALLAALEQQRHNQVAFMADVAHDIKNAAATMAACGEALGRDAAPGPERMARIRRALDASSARVTRLAEDFVELARADAGLPDVERVRFDLRPRLEALVIAAQSRNPTLAVELTGGSALVDRAPEALDRAWANLLDNGADFAGRGGGHLVVAISTDAAAVHVTVTDDGPGIAEADRPRIFERYFSRRTDGSGLGLAIARAIIEAHGGRIAVGEASGGGTVVRVALPRTPSA